MRNRCVSFCVSFSLCSGSAIEVVCAVIISCRCERGRVLKEEDSRADVEVCSYRA